MVNILVVDDEPQIRELVKKRLSKEGFHCQEASNGYECLKVLRKEEFKLVITDIRMPGIDGLKLIGRLKIIRPDMRFVVITAEQDKGVKDEALSLGIEDFIPKPFDLDEFTERVIKIQPPDMEHKQKESTRPGSEVLSETGGETRTAIYQELAGLYYLIGYRISHWYRRELRDYWLLYALFFLIGLIVIFGITKGIEYLEEREKKPGVYELLKRGVEALEKDNVIDKMKLDEMERNQ